MQADDVSLHTFTNLSDVGELPQGVSLLKGPYQLPCEMFHRAQTRPSTIQSCPTTGHSTQIHARETTGSRVAVRPSHPFLFGYSCEDSDNSRRSSTDQGMKLDNARPGTSCCDQVWDVGATRVRVTSRLCSTPGSAGSSASAHTYRIMWNAFSTCVLHESEGGDR